MKVYLAIILVMLAGCSTVVPQFDIPADDQGQPTVATIVERVRCDLAEVAVQGGFRNYLVDQKANVAVQLNLDVTDTGALSPSFEYIDAPFSFLTTPTISQSRDQSFNQLLHFDMEQVAAEFRNPKRFDLCKIGPNNLEGRLGIKESILLAGTAPNPDLTAPLSGTNGVFGGFVQFVVTKSVGAGPNWTLKRFAGPGKLATVSRVNTDKIVFAVAFSQKDGKSAAQEKASRFIDQININQLTVQFGGVNNAIQTSQRGIGF